MLDSVKYYQKNRDKFKKTAMDVSTFEFVDELLFPDELDVIIPIAFNVFGPAIPSTVKPFFL